MEDAAKAEIDPRDSLPNADACIAAWRDMVDLGYELAFNNLRSMGRSPADAMRTLPQWLDRDAEERFRALQRLGELRSRSGE